MLCKKFLKTWESLGSAFSCVHNFSCHAQFAKCSDACGSGFDRKWIAVQPAHSTPQFLFLICLSHEGIVFAECRLLILSDVIIPLFFQVALCLVHGATSNVYRQNGGVATMSAGTCLPLT